MSIARCYYNNYSIIQANQSSSKCINCMSIFGIQTSPWSISFRDTQSCQKEIDKTALHKDNECTGVRTRTRC